MFAIFIEITYRKGGTALKSGEPIKFVNTEIDAKAFCGNKDNEWLLSPYKYGDYKNAEFVYKEWTLADFAEYCREQFKEINERFDNL